MKLHTFNKFWVLFQSIYFNILCCDDGHNLMHLRELAFCLGESVMNSELCRLEDVSLLQTFNKPVSWGVLVSIAQ